MRHTNLKTKSVCTKDHIETQTLLSPVCLDHRKNRLLASSTTWMTVNENLSLSIQMKATEQNVSVIDAILFIALHQLGGKINVTSVRIKRKVHQWNDQIATWFVPT